MGTLYNVKCTHCGYSFEARYGGGRNCDDTLLLKKRFEEGKAEKGLQGIFDALRKTVTESEERDNREFVSHDSSIQTEEELQEAVMFFKAPWVSDSWHVYECLECKKLFNRKRIRMTCNKGEFEERYVKCPKCGDPLAAPVDEEEFHPKNPENADDSICDVECPKCNENLTVVSWGFWD